ncbi:MAG: UDP-N-acetylmuramate--L-alanine ligase [Longimicrobiales bacterium]|nr:UDP-N-acetylmuramate--L-alanine ligase [Longimicrobiales bacterium]
MKTTRIDELAGAIHFMGIGGAGMCGLAELLAGRGRRVTGCDAHEGAAVRRLRALGVEVSIGHDPAHLAGIDAVIVTAAVPAAHPELEAARAAGVPVWKRARALGAVVGEGRVVAIAGTHGKTSTSALVVHLLDEAGLDPTGIVGGSVSGWDGNLHPGGDDLYVVEADEFDRSFLHLTPDVAVVTNLEADHLEIYGSLEGVREGFRAFLGQLREGGRAIVCADDSGAAGLVSLPGSTAYTYGTTAGAQLRAAEIEFGESGTHFRIFEEGIARGGGELDTPGRHTLLNALAAAAVARVFGVEWDVIRRGWRTHRGVHRRFERLGAVGEIEVVDDYAHHPTEIAVTLRAARDAWPDRRIVAVFQPHLYTRTRDFAGEFGAALAQADVAWVTSIFPAREPPLEGVDHTLVVDAIRAAGGVAHEHDDLDTLARAVAQAVLPGDVVIGMGAGSIERFAPALVTHLREGIHA